MNTQTNRTNNEWTRWLVVVVFAIGMAWVESAVVYYLRTMINRIEPYQPNPLPVFGGLAFAELVREAATILMLATVGWLAGRTWRSRFGYFVLAFGMWDIFYYVFLKVLTPWPNSLLDWDILFLLPLPWWGPVISPVLIACLMIAFGTMVSQYDEPDRVVWPTAGPVVASLVGAGLALYVFMADAIDVAAKGQEALRNLLPVKFNWPLFSLALVMMAAPVVQVARQVMPRRQLQLGTPETI